MELTAKNVKEVFIDCLFKDTEIVKGKPVVEPIKVEGITSNFGFHPERLKGHKKQIAELLWELPFEFFKGRGGSWSFLNACMDKHGNQWGEHRNIEQLFCLGIGLNMAKYVFPRKMWPVFPGGLPYVTILTTTREG